MFDQLNHHLIRHLKQTPDIPLYRKTTQKTTQKKTRPAVSTKEKICALLQEKPELTQQSLAKLIGVSTSAIKQHLVDLKKSGLIERKGSDRAGYWQVNNFE